MGSEEVRKGERDLAKRAEVTAACQEMKHAKESGGELIGKAKDWNDKSHPQTEGHALVHSWHILPTHES